MFSRSLPAQIFFDNLNEWQKSLGDRRAEVGESLPSPKGSLFNLPRPKPAESLGQFS